MNLGDTFRPIKYDSHLWIVSSKPELDPVVIFNLTTYTVDEENICVLHIGDHEFITHKTAIRYWEAKRVEAKLLEALIEKSLLNPNKPASQEMMKKIWLGASLSRRINLNVLDILESQGLLPS